MNAVFCCPRCNTALGTPDDPRPEPLPPCPQCGWTPIGNGADSAARKWAQILRPGLGLAMFAFGVVAGALTGHSLLLVLFPLIGFGVVVPVSLAVKFERGWQILPPVYLAGYVTGLTWLNDGQTATAAELPLNLKWAGLMLAVSWVAGWLKHSE